MGLQADLGEVEGVLEDLRDHACGLHVDQYRVGADTEDHARCQRQYPSLPEQHLTGEQEARLWGEGTPWFVVGEVVDVSAQGKARALAAAKSYERLRLREPRLRAIEHRTMQGKCREPM